MVAITIENQLQNKAQTADRLCRDSSFRTAAVGLQRNVSESGRDHLPGQRNVLCGDGPSVPVSDGTRI